jgi:hypothetical protein
MAWIMMREGRDKSATTEICTCSSCAISSAAMLRISASLADCAHTSSSPRSSCKNRSTPRCPHSVQPHTHGDDAAVFGLPGSSVERQ